MLAQTTMDSNYDIFISYSHDDSAWVELLRWLKARHPQHPTEPRLLRIFTDLSPRTGLNWPAELERALTASACLLAVVSKSAIESEVCRMELPLKVLEDPAALRGRVLVVVCGVPPPLLGLRQWGDLSSIHDFDAAESHDLLEALWADIAPALSPTAQPRQGRGGRSTHSRPGNGSVSAKIGTLHARDTSFEAGGHVEIEIDNAVTDTFRAGGQARRTRPHDRE